MAGPTMALYANPPLAVCSPPNQINSQISYDFDLQSYSSSLFSSPVMKQCSAASLPLSFSSGSEEKGLLFHEVGDEFRLKERALSSSLCYSPSKFFGPSKREGSSPVSVLHGPISCCRSDAYANASGCRVLYGGFVRNALGNSLVDCYGFGSSSPVAIFGGMADPEELNFTLEDKCGKFRNGDRADYSVEEMLVDAQAKHSIFREEFVVKAFYEAERAHRGQVRASGHPYLQHCVETAVLLATIGATSTVVAAGLLHDTLDDSFTSYDHISRTFGASVADLVGGVSKLSQLSQLARENNTASKIVEADRSHTMFLAMEDARSVLIKLADRLHNMMTLEALPEHKQRRFAKETLEIFVPLANCLGILTWKERLENLCFKHLHPELHEKLSSQLFESYDETVVVSTKEKLEESLKEKSFPYHLISGRHKSLYSIYHKMIKKNLGMDEIHDVHGVRLIVETEEDCYRALRIVHQLWPEVPGKFKDFIVRPKFNGYRSLHTVVMSDRMVPIEVQIRTKGMHLQAEFGLAAHWRYEEGDWEHSAFVLRLVKWARWVITWQCETMSRDRRFNMRMLHLHPEIHEKLSSQLFESYDETVVVSTKEKLEESLKEKSFPYHLISRRHKSLYSIHHKMIKNNLGMDEIHDVHGVRLIVETEEDCYRALRIVHQLWPEVPGKFKDFIVRPKFNGYRSLHTVVMSDRMVPIEVQIRTKGMHLQAEFGLAAHWRYKEGDCEHSAFVLQLVEWARWVITWQCETMSRDRRSIGDLDAIKPPCRFPSHSDDCAYSCKPRRDNNGPAFIIIIENEKMSVQEFQADSTIMDLLAQVGRGILRQTPYGFHLKEELRPRVNGQANVDPTCKLSMGDVVDLMPAVSRKSLTEYREEIQRMYNCGLPMSGPTPSGILRLSGEAS